MRTTARDQGLRRVSSITRWVAAAGVGVVGVFSVMVAKVHPGTTKAAAAASSTSSSSAASSSGAAAGSSQGTGGSSASGLQSVPAPSSSRGSASVVSGAS
jgi:hypothetical protein